MSTLFGLLLFASVVGLVIGLISPKVFGRFIKNATRKSVALTFGAIAVVSLIGAVATAGPATETKSQEQQQKKVITYDIVKRWSIPNGGEGKVVVISHDYLNEADMVALGEKLKSDVREDRNAFISVFDDKQGALLRDKVLGDKASETETNLYDQHFVGQYDKNANTGFHQFAIWFDGVMGTNHKTIKY